MVKLSSTGYNQKEEVCPMMRSTIVLLLVAFLVTFANGHNSTLFSLKEIDLSFGNFKNIFRKFYKSLNIESDRKRIFSENLQFIESFNLNPTREFRPYRLAVNNFTDLSQDEYHRLYNGFIERNTARSSGQEEMMLNLTEAQLRQSLPRIVDWTQEGVVTPVKNQGSCGSCWTFSAVAAIESHLAIQTGQLRSLSEQNLLDCAVYGNNGCAGGLMNNAFEYIIQNGGIDTEDSYPYQAVQRFCRFSRYSIGARISSYVNIHQGNEAELQYVVANNGPVSIGIDASQRSFQFYSGGVYDDRACSSVNLNHGVVIVGYGTTTDGIPYWKIKNSWSSMWGQGGYMLLRRNAGNLCGIATTASYPVL